MTELTHDNFAAEAEQTQIPVLIDFFSEKCSPCKAMGIVFDSLAEQYHSRCKFCKVDVDAQADLARQFHILSVPTLVLLDRGEVVQRIRGYHSKQDILKILNLS